MKNMKIKSIILGALVLAVTLVCAASYFRGNYAFLASATTLNASTTKVNGTDFTSLERDISEVSSILVTVTFTRAAGSASKVKYYYQVSYDDGTTWTDFVDAINGTEYLEVATNHGIISGTTVRVAQVFILPGASHIRLAKLVNEDTVNNLTDVNATLSY